MTGVWKALLLLGLCKSAKMAIAKVAVRLLVMVRVLFIGNLLLFYVALLFVGLSSLKLKQAADDRERELYIP